MVKVNKKSVLNYSWWVIRHILQDFQEMTIVFYIFLIRLTRVIYLYSILLALHYLWNDFYPVEPRPWEAQKLGLPRCGPSLVFSHLFKGARTRMKTAQQEGDYDLSWWWEYKSLEHSWVSLRLSARSYPSGKHVAEVGCEPVGSLGQPPIWVIILNPCTCLPSIVPPPPLNRVKLTSPQGKALRETMPFSAVIVLFINCFPGAQASHVKTHTVPLFPATLSWNILCHSSSLSPYICLVEELTSSRGTFPLALCRG